MLLYHLGQRHLDQAGPYLRRMETEDIATVAGEAYEVVEHGERETCNMRTRVEWYVAVLGLLSLGVTTREYKSSCPRTSQFRAQII
jgi:hypothetical protein